MVQEVGAEHRQGEAEQQHRRRDAEGGAGQRAAAVDRREHRAGRDQDRDHRHPPAEDLQQPEAAADLGEVGRGEHHELGVHLRDLGGGPEPGLDQGGLHPVDHRPDVDHDLVVLQHHRAAALAGEGLDHGCVPGPYRLFPDGGEGVAGDHPVGGGVHQVGQRPLQRSGQAAQQLGQPGRHALLGGGLGQVVHQGLDVDLLRRGVGDPVGQGVLDVGVVGQRRHGGDEPVGVGDLVVGPDRDDREQRQHRRDHHQDDRAGGAQPVVLLLAPGVRLQLGDPAVQRVQFDAVRAAWLRGARLPGAGLGRWHGRGSSSWAARGRGTPPGGPVAPRGANTGASSQGPRAALGEQG